MKVSDFARYVSDRKQATGGGTALNQDEGVLYGDANAEARGVLFCWMATVDALERAATEGCNLVVCHEMFYFCPIGSAGLQPQQPAWRPNYRRLAVCGRAGLTVFRAHGTLDRITIYDAFAERLGLKNPNPGTGWDKVFPIPPTSVRDLVARVRQTMGLKQVRMVGGPDQRVTCLGLPWGGLGLDSNVGYMQRLLELGADGFIAGETDEYGLTFASDAGVPLIETGHAASENIGLELFAQQVQRDFPGLKVATFTRPTFVYAE
ncbi:MAG: hypothetical protein FJ279_35365 [Planctomycetes bacterium]|nr:hypothetical protein [Planctomycetota bacterium]